jgi:hypothetical protein
MVPWEKICKGKNDFLKVLEAKQERCALQTNT